MSAFRRMMGFLGLAYDDEYDEYEGYDDTAAQPSAGAVAPARGVARPAMADPLPDPGGSSIRTLPRDYEQPSGVTMAPRVSSVVRPLTPVASSKPVTVTPKSFQDAKEIGDRLKAGVPVIVNLQGADRDLTRRIVDFASGLTYAVDGEMEQTASRVYLLTPTAR
jgi:cell division inhibitor SepF